MSASTVSRPTENAAIGRVRPRRLDLLDIVHLRDQARARLDLAYVYLLDHLLVRALNPEVGEK
jgi:hypothetical protein